MDLKDILDEAIRAGWSIEKTSGGHLRLTHQAVAASIITGSTPSDWRALHNLRARLRRSLRDTNATTPMPIQTEPETEQVRDLKRKLKEATDELRGVKQENDFLLQQVEALEATVIRLETALETRREQGTDLLLSKRSRRRDPGSILDEGASLRMIERRTYLGVSQADLGRRVGVTGAMISRYELMQTPVPPGMLERICDALGSTTAAILRGEETPITIRRPKPSVASPFSLGRRVASIREGLGMRQVDLAARINVSPTTISKLESGGYRQAPSWLGDVARVLSVPLADLTAP